MLNPYLQLDKVRSNKTAMNFLFEIDKVLHEFTSYCSSGRDC